MPQAPYARILVSINGGPPQRGGVQASFGDTVRLSAESTIGWGIPAAVWEITSYPVKWPPPPGWSVDPVTKAYVVLGNLSSLPPFPLPAAKTGLWGKWKFRLRINGGGGSLTDASTAVEIVSPHGVHDLASSEANEFGLERGWPGDQQKNLRLLDQAMAGAGSTLASLAVSAPLRNTGSATAAQLAIDPVSASADGAMLHADKVKLDAATSNAVADTLVARDAIASSTFHVVLAEAGVVVPASGALGVMQLQATSGVGSPAFIRAQQGAAGQRGGTLTLGGGDAGTPGAANSWAGDTHVDLGELDAANHLSAGFQLLAGTTGAFLTITCSGGSAVMTAIALTMAAGSASLALNAAGIDISAPRILVTDSPPARVNNPPSGVYLFADTGAWKARSAGGVVTTMAPAGKAVAASQILDWIANSLQTTTNLATAILVYALPPNALVELDASVQAVDPASGKAAWFRRVMRFKRGSGVLVLKSTSTPIADDDELGGLGVLPGINGTNVQVLVQGPASLALTWFASARVQLFAL